MEPSFDELRQQLSAVRGAREALMVRGRSTRVALSRYNAAHERVLEAERKLAAAAGDQYAIPVELGLVPQTGVSAPVLLQNDLSAVITFSALTVGSDDSQNRAGTAIIEFDLCQWTSFGYPNGEALPGHPLYGHGLSPYGIFQVHNSQWLSQIFERNKVAFPNTKPWNAGHFLFSFDDSTFECLCRGIKMCSVSQEPYPIIFERISSAFKSDAG